jgi:hypothetical protein
VRPAFIFLFLQEQLKGIIIRPACSVVEYCGKGIGNCDSNMKMARGRKFEVWQPGGKKGGGGGTHEVVSQGLANPESRTCDGNLSRTPDPE